MRTLAMGTIVVTCLALASCSMPTTTSVVEPGPSDHAHQRPSAKNAGDWHVYNFMNRRASRIGVQILDRYEEPYYLSQATLRARLTRSNGKTLDLELVGEGYEPPVGLEEYSGQRSSATVYSVQLPWIRDAHQVALTVWVPLPDGKTYKLDFECVARDEAPTHSGL